MRTHVASGNGRIVFHSGEFDTPEYKRALAAALARGEHYGATCKAHHPFGVPPIEQDCGCPR